MGSLPDQPVRRTAGRKQGWGDGLAARACDTAVAVILTSATHAANYDATLFLAASHATFIPRLSAMLPIHEVRAASKPVWMGALGVLRLRTQSRKFFT